MQILFPKLALPDVQYRFPGACLVCGQSCSGAHSICSCCESALPYIEHFCRRCGEGHSPGSLFQGQCGRCLVNPPVFDTCFPTFHYATPVDRLITDFKYHGGFAAGFALGNIMATQLQGLIGTDGMPQLLVPVPQHRTRLRQRGFNQSWQLCRLLSHRLKIPSHAGMLVKIRNTRAQSELPAAARRKRNLRGAFAMVEMRKPRNVNHVAIVDDVVTTMSTASELARVLKSHGICRVEVWCLARAKR